MSAQDLSAMSLRMVFKAGLVFNPSNPVATIRNMTNLGNKEIVAQMIDKVNMLVDGGELI